MEVYSRRVLTLFKMIWYGWKVESDTLKVQGANINPRATNKHIK